MENDWLTWNACANKVLIGNLSIRHFNLIYAILTVSFDPKTFSPPYKKLMLKWISLQWIQWSSSKARINIYGNNSPFFSIMSEMENMFSVLSLQPNPKADIRGFPKTCNPWKKIRKMLYSSVNKSTRLVKMRSQTFFFKPSPGVDLLLTFLSFNDMIMSSDVILLKPIRSHLLG